MDEVGIAIIFRGVAFNVEDDVCFVLGASGVFQSDEEFSRIEVDTQLMRPAGTADSEVAHKGFLAGERFFPCDLIPLLALFQNGGGDALPNNAAEADGGFMVQAFFLRFKILGQLSSKKFLCRLFGPIARHSPTCPK